MFVAVFSIIAKNWNQPRRSSVGERISNPWYIHYSVLEEMNSKATKRHRGTFSAYY